ncbi:MAG TPA: tetratricopeptide repeat protein [Candidatus Angelobacter sp.]|jgi:tetratricopeptide (TPR) repeat protein
MTTNLLRIAGLLIVTLTITNAYAARFHSDIYRASTVYVCELAHDKCERSAPELIQKLFVNRNRWTFVTEPEKADLILVWFGNSYTASTAMGRVSISNTWHFSGLVVLKGGSAPDWNAVPLYVTNGKYASPMIQEFYDEVIQTAPLFVPPSALVSMPNTTHHIVGWGRSIEEYTQILADEPGNAMAYYARGAAYFDLGEYEKAIKDFNMALILKPDFEEAQTRLESAKKAKAAADCHYQIFCPK